MSNVALFRYGSPAQLKSRLQLLMELSDVKKVQLDTIEFRWSGPDVGWLDMTVLKNGEEVLSDSISYVYSPFPEMILWLLRMAKERYPSMILDFDIEGVQMQFCCDYLGWRKRGKKYEDIALFTISRDWNDKMKPVFFVLPVMEFIRQLYYSLQDYFHLHKAIFMQEWLEYQYEDDCLERIEADFTSAELESLVPRIGKPPVIPPHFTDIPRTDEEAFAQIDALMASTHTKHMSGDELYRWICDNWIYSPKGEEKKILDKRAAWFKVMSAGEYEFAYDWCFDDASPTVNTFLGRYYSYVKEKQ